MMEIRGQSLIGLLLLTTLFLFACNGGGGSDKNAPVALQYVIYEREIISKVDIDVHLIIDLATAVEQALQESAIQGLLSRELMQIQAPF